MDPIFELVAASGPLRAVGEDLLFGYGAGTAFGTFVAYRQKQRNVRVDVFATVTRWSAVGVGVVAVAKILKLG